MDRRVNKSGTNSKKIKVTGSRGNSFSTLLCMIILLSGVVIRFAFGGTNLQKNLSRAIHGNMDYRQVIATVGRAAAGEEDIVSVFNAVVLPDGQEKETEISIENDKSPAQEEIISPVEENSGEDLDEQPMDLDNIEKLSFEMSEAELSDDTEAKLFVIPPPSNCSYDKIEIPFRYTTPLHGRITSKYGYRDHPVNGDGGFHTGIDIAAAQGTAVKAFAAGKVSEAGKNNVYGNYVLLEHSQGIYSFYGHNSRLCVKKGDKIKLGEKIAEVGTTGLSTGPHLHFEVRNGKKRLNPKFYISPEQL